MDKSWKSLEMQVRQFAEILWRTTANPERIDGVNFDAVLRISDDEIILMEITEEHSLEKIRSDISKILPVKLRLASESIVARAFIILRDEPTPGMIDIGKGSKISVLSFDSFASQVIDYPAYITLRSRYPFGSAIDPTTGKPDINEYVPVEYSDVTGHRLFKIADICAKLIKRERIVLLGDYGTGKSRCILESFHHLCNEIPKGVVYPLAINLREHWGAASGIEIIVGHFSRLGLSSTVDRAMQLLQTGHLILLLDGFDEVGTQTFGNSEDRRISIRKEALHGIRDLISISPSGVLVTGRPHYFNSNSELIEALGLSLRNDKCSILKSPDEFNEDQASSYLTALKLPPLVPQWLPRKPLMFQILAAMDPIEAGRVLQSQSGEIGFWGQFIDTVCEREAKIHSSIEASTVRLVLGNLARTTRLGTNSLGQLTPKDISKAFELATGYAPDEAGQLMLSRLCTLGRIGPESPDRQFVDPYIVQLLFAECIVDDISSKKHEVLKEQWHQALQPLGLYFLAQWIDIYDFESDALSYIHRDGKPTNEQIIGEIAAALLVIEAPPVDFGGIRVLGAELCVLALGIRQSRNIAFSDCIIELFALDNCLVDESSQVAITNSEIVRATGMTSTAVLPTWIVGCKIYQTDSISNAARIKSSPLPPAQKLFLAIVHKIFFQKGGGRKENSLYKGGFGQQFDKKLIDKILSTLVNQGYVERGKDGGGHIYNPKREYTARMKAIRDQLSLSKDPLWLQMEKLD